MKTQGKHSGASVLTGVLVLVAMGGPEWTVAPPPPAGLAAGPGGPSPTPQAADTFLKIEGMEGEFSAATHKGWVEVQSWSWGVLPPRTSGVGATGRLEGRATLSKRIDKATPLLFKRCSDGTALPLATVELARTGGGQTYLKYELRDVMVTSISHGDMDGDGVLDEEIKLEFTGVKLSYTQLDGSGKPVGQTVGEGAIAPAVF